MSLLHVLCKVDGGNYAIPANDVYQLESFTPPTRVPGAPHYVLGVTQVRQQIVPVIDLRLRLGLIPREPTADSRLVVLKLEARLVGLLVDSAREIESIAPELFSTNAALHADQAAGGFVRAIAEVKGKIILLIDSLRIAGEEPNHG